MTEKYKGRGTPFSNEPTLKEFKELFDDYSNEIGISDPDGFIASHKIKAGIGISCINNNKYYKIIGLDIGQLGGCGCWSDIYIEIEECDDI